MKTFAQIVNQPTVKDGSLKQGLAITKLAQANLSVNFTGSIDVQGKSLEIGAIVAAALIPAFDNKCDANLEELLTLYSEGFVIQQQKNIAAIIAAGGTTAKKPAMPLTAGSVLSAADYLTGNLRVIQLDNIALYTDLARLLANTDKTTKAQLIEFAVNLLDQLLPQTVMEVYNEKVRKEAELSAQFAELTELGFSDIQPVSESTYSAILTVISKEVIAATLQGLTSKGYLLKDSQVNLADATIKVIFAKQSDN